jgi:hypothetical protein
VAQDPQDGINQMPRQLMVLRILGFAALLAFPLVTAIGFTISPYLLLLMPSTLVLLGFILLGAGFRIAGGVFRGALAGAGLYVLIGVAFSVFLAVRSQPVFQIAFERSPYIVVQILFEGEQWPVLCLLILFRVPLMSLLLFGGFG